MILNDKSKAKLHVRRSRIIVHLLSGVFINIRNMLLTQWSARFISSDKIQIISEVKSGSVPPLLYMVRMSCLTLPL